MRKEYVSKLPKMRAGGSLLFTAPVALESGSLEEGPASLCFPEPGEDPQKHAVMGPSMLGEELGSSL